MISSYQWHPYELQAFLIGVVTGAFIVGWPLLLRRLRIRR